MRSLSARAHTTAGIFVVLAAACGPSLAATREPAREPAGPGCTRWTGHEPMCGPSLTLFEDQALEVAVVSIPQPSSLVIAWSMPEELADRAEATVLAGGFELSGWAALSERRFSLREGHPLEPAVLRAHAGTPIRVVGRAESGLEVELATALRTPGAVRTVIACDELGTPEYEPPPGVRGRGSLGWVGVPGGQLTVHDAPGGTAALEVALFEGAGLSLLEERDGWAHVVSPDYGDYAVSLDGWVEARLLVRDPELDRDSGCHPPDGHSFAPDAVARTGSVVEVGPEPGSPSRIRVVPGAEVRIVERREAHVAIEPADGDFGPPEGARFWVATGDLRECGTDGACP